MKILDILHDAEITGAEKLKTLKSLVETIRATYGNEDAEITEEKVATSEGYMSLSLLTVDEKVTAATSSVKMAIAAATARTELEEGTVFDSEFERLIARDALLTNLSVESDSAY